MKKKVFLILCLSLLLTSCSDKKINSEEVKLNSEEEKEQWLRDNKIVEGKKVDDSVEGYEMIRTDMLGGLILSGDGFEFSSKTLDYSELDSEIVLNLNFEYTNTSDVSADAFTIFAEKYTVSSELKPESGSGLQIIEPDDRSTEPMKMAKEMIEPGKTVNVTISFIVKDPSTELFLFDIPENKNEAGVGFPILSYDEWIELDEN